MCCHTEYSNITLSVILGIDILRLAPYTVNHKEGEGMEVRHAKNDLLALEMDPSVTGGYPPGVTKAFRMRMQFIRSAVDERDFYAWKSIRYEKLKGNRSHQHSMRLNNQYRLVLEYEEKSSKKIAVIVGIEDYH
jgi:toxin HigB-1